MIQSNGESQVDKTNILGRIQRGQRETARYRATLSCLLLHVAVTSGFVPLYPLALLRGSVFPLLPTCPSRMIPHRMGDISVEAISTRSTLASSHACVAGDGWVDG